MKQWQNDRALDANTECKNIVMADTVTKQWNDRQNTGKNDRQNVRRNERWNIRTLNKMTDITIQRQNDKALDTTTECNNIIRSDTTVDRTLDRTIDITLEGTTDRNLEQ